MTEERCFGKVKCTVTNENVNLFISDEFAIRTNDVDKSGNKVLMIIPKEQLDDEGAHLYIEQELLKRLAR